MENTENLEVRQDLRQSKEYGEYMTRIGWKVIEYKVSSITYQVFLRRLGPVAIAKIQRVQMPLPNMDKIFRKNRVMMCKVEPVAGAPDGYKKDNWPLLASKTLRVDLRPNEDKIMGSFSKDCRYTLRKCLMSNAECLINDFDGFYEIWKKSSKRKNLWIPSKKDYMALIECFGKNVFVICVNNIAGALILVHDRCAYYYYAGATHEGNKNNLPYAVVWAAMKQAKKMGCKTWDFEGVYDGRYPNKGWLGFSRFKKGFGGEEMELAGSYVKWRWPF